MQNNIPAVLSVMKFIYENIMYAELNTKSDYCEKCGYDGEIKVIERMRPASWCGNVHNCGNRDQNTVVCSAQNLWLYRYTVLESGTHSGDQGPGTSPVRGADK